MEGILIGVMVIILAIYFGTRYLDGDLSIQTEEIIKQGNITREGVVIGTYYEIKREYVSGRIKIYVKNLTA